MWFDDSQDLLRILLVGVSAYVGLLVLLRLSGKRTLAKLTPFDFVVTIALGSTLSTILLDTQISLADGLFALWLLIVLQFAVAAASARYALPRRAVYAAPTVVLEDGVPQEAAMRRHRVNHAELCQAARNAGLGDLHSAAAIVLEPNGSLSVVPASQAGDRSAIPG